MADVHTVEQRRLNMSAIHHKNTKPEVFVRKELHKRGFRFRIHHRGLPGNPDIVLPKYNAVVFVNGCFWHGHECHLFKWPKTREDFWREKISATTIRDSKNASALLALGFRVLTVWECAIKGSTRLDHKYLMDITSDWIKSNSVIAEIPNDPQFRNQPQ